MIEKIGQSEAYVMGTSSEGRLYHLIVDNAFMFSISNLRDAVIDFFIMFRYFEFFISFYITSVFSLLELFHPELLICFQNSNNLFFGQEKQI